jgi:HEAT repeat protein
LRAASADRDEWVRYYACQALGRLCAESAVDVLVERLADPSGQVRVSAVEALTALRSPKVFPALAAVARSEDADLQRAAIAGMGRHFRPEALAILRDAVSN